ncbi:polyphenol oxidoreductase [Pseudoduganella eburnea]|uniref:Polyphenol oxidoreductase n=1 Tax=Massilia eburnea TaxID=1776165 RepID=A0A6L6QMM5_9BURK|nr:polyphenol oxidase family protein [Massilia eburnea]MTW13334.1 polyphenol oxidoreductase [Massilia eburnea]
MVTSRLLNSIPGIRHGFGCAAALVPPVLENMWSLRPVKRQVHGTHVAPVELPEQAVGEADGFVTAVAGLPVSVITADCVPLLLARRDATQVAAVHAGWRGLYDGIIPAALAEMGEGAPIAAAVGPTICVECYEVSEELANDFAGKFGPSAVPAFRHLDLRAIAEQQLRAAGVEEIEHVGGCTCCTCDAAGEPIYRSYRRGDRGSQMHSGLYITSQETT